MNSSTRFWYKVLVSLKNLKFTLVVKKKYTWVSPFFLILLCGCHRGSFQKEQEQAQLLAKKIIGEDIAYGKEGDTLFSPTLPQELSRDEAIRIALLNNKELRASLYELGIAKTALADAVLFQNPLISVTTSSSLNNEGIAAVNYFDVQTQVLSIPDLIQIPLRRRMYSTQLEIAVYSFVNKMIEIIAQTRIAYDKVLVHRALIENIDDSLHHIGEKNSAPSSAKHPEHRVIHKQHVSSLAKITYEISKLTYMKELVTALVELRVLLGVEPECFSSVKLSSSLTEPMIPLPSLSDLLAWAENSHVDILIAHKKIQYALESVAYEKSKLFERTAIGSNYYKDLDVNQTGAGIYFVGSVPLFHQNQPRIDQAEYIAERSRWELNDKLNKIKASISLAYEKIILQKRIVDTYEKELLMVKQESIDHMQKFKKRIKNGDLFMKKKRLECNEIRAKSLEARYHLSELYTNLEKVCSKRLFFSQSSTIKRLKGELNDVPCEEKSSSLTAPHVVLS